MLDTLKGELRIFTKEVETKDGKTRVIFNACVGSSKDEEGNYTNYYMPVNFANAIKKDVAKVYKDESFDCIVKEAWIKAYKNKDDHTMPILFINKAKVMSVDSDEEDEEEEKPKKKPQAKKSTTGKKSKADEDDLPF